MVQSRNIKRIGVTERKAREMSKRMILCVLFVFLCGSMAIGQEVGEGPAGTDSEAEALGITLDATFVSQYIWRGYDVFDDSAAFQPSVNWDIADTGFSVNVWASQPFGSSNEEIRELDTTLAYGTTLFAEEAYAVDLGVNYLYFDYYRANSHIDLHELGGWVFFPSLLTIGDQVFVPSYYVGKDWPNESSTPGVSGWFHVLGVSTDVVVPGLSEDDWFQTLSLGADVTYNDGAFGADHDWSHVTLSLSTSLPVGPVTLTPALYYQVSMDDSVNPDDELYGGLSVTYGF